MSDDEIISSSSESGSDIEDFVPIKNIKPKKPVIDEDDDIVSDGTDGSEDDKNEDSDDGSEDNASDAAESTDNELDEDARNLLKQNIGIDSDSGDEEDDENEDDEDEDEYFQKFDEQLKTNVISEYHPEMLQHNYEEINALTTITYVDGIIDDPLHRTIPILTKYEKARILGERAKQINSGAKPFVSVDETVIDGYLIALKELEERKIPFIIRRPLPSGACEYWKIKDLEMLL
jgi:DNA-directed RNA polymerase I, II, and III subunit RPABC2